MAPAQPDPPENLADQLNKAHAELLLRLETWFAKVEESLGRREADMGLAQQVDIGHHTSDKGSLCSFSDPSVKLADPLSASGQFKEPGARVHPFLTGSAPQSVASDLEEYVHAKEQGSRMESFKEYVSSSYIPKQKNRLELWCGRIQVRAALIADSLPFNIFFALVIFSNSVFLGLQLEWSALKVDKFVEPAFLITHMVYASLFSLEMSIRVTAAGPKAYFCGTGWAWNWLDVLVVVPAWVELAMDFLARGGTEGTGTSNFRIIRVFKVTRMLQVVRSLRIVRFIGALRALVLSVIDTTRQLIWALLLLALVIYSFAILFTDASQDHMFRNGIDENLGQYWGSVYASSTTLFRSIQNGIDWAGASDSLTPLGMFWVQLFNMYIAFCGFAVLNVMTGVFVNSAIKTREKDHETMLQNVQRFKDLVQKVWKKIDVSGMGQITISEFEGIFKDEDMMTFFDAIEINAVDAWTLFNSLDSDGNHLVSYEEFQQRCMQLHGPARSVDLFDLKQRQDKMWAQLKGVEVLQQDCVRQQQLFMRAVAPKMNLPLTWADNDPVWSM